MMLEAGPLSAVTERLPRACASAPAGAAAASRFGGTPTLTASGGARGVEDMEDVASLSGAACPLAPADPPARNPATDPPDASGNANLQWDLNSRMASWMISMADRCVARSSSTAHQTRNASEQGTSGHLRQIQGRDRSAVAAGHSQCFLCRACDLWAACIARKASWHSSSSASWAELRSSSRFSSRLTACAVVSVRVALPREYLTQGAHRILDLVDLLPAQTVALALGVVRLRVVPSLKVQRLPQAVAVRIAPPPPRNAGQRAQLRHAGQTCASSRACCELVADVRRRRADKGHLSRPIIRSTRSSPMVSRHLRA